MIVLVVTMLLIILFIPIGIAVGKRQNRFDWDNDNGNVDQNTESNGIVTGPVMAKVVARYSVSDNQNPQKIINIVAFELENGNTENLEVRDSLLFYTMLDGEVGLIEFYHNKLKKFHRV